MFIKYIYTLGLFLSPIFAHKNDKLEISTPSGIILGSSLTTRLGKTIYAFRGIRYAEPPINDLRFKPPVPIESWEGVYNATVDGTLCPQPGIGATLPVSEDCLFLNVYSTKLVKEGVNKTRQKLRPVILHFHPGGFYSSTGYSVLAGPQYFMDQDIILVTMNYRLATLGFLSLGTKDCPGNNGLKDQVVAMKWIRKNIAAFGGDPNSVTLYGYSAGAWSITLHMVSKMSRGLFHKGIIGSGSALGEYPLPSSQLDIARKQARIFNCTDESPKGILACLKTVSAVDLGNSFFQFWEFGNNPTLIWSPVIEEDFGQERFLSENPIKTYESGNFEKIPVIIGITKYEFANNAFPLVGNATLLAELSNNYEKYAPICFVYERDSEKSKEVSRATRKYYLGDSPLSNSSLTGLEKLYADALVGFPTDRAAKIIASKSTWPVYYYKFTYHGRYSNFYLPDTNNTVPLGAVHHDDLMYSFYISVQFPFFNSSFPESEMVEKLTKLWANFARTGNPTPDSDPVLDNAKWETYDLVGQKYLNIGDKFKMETRLYSDRYAVWEKLYPVSIYL